MGGMLQEMLKRAEKDITEEERRRENTQIRFRERAIESRLARAFVKWRKTVDPSERATLWREIEDAAEKLEEMSE